MTTSPDSTDVTTEPAKHAGGRWLYPILLAVETSGAIVIYREGLPLLRQLVHNASDFVPRASTPAWSLAAIALIQVAYWVGHWVRPVLPRYVNPLLGHIALFVARLVFLLASAAFSFVFIANTLATPMPAFRYVLFLAILFSLFCYTLELERLGRALLDPDSKLDRIRYRGRNR